MKDKVAYAVTILIVIVILLAILNHNKSYTTLEQAVDETSRGGKIEEKIKSPNGYYVYIKNSTVITNAYYFINRKRWYYDSTIVTKTYELEKGVTLKDYFLPNQGFTIVEILQEEPTDVEITDNEGTTFTKRKTVEGQYVGIVDKNIGPKYVLNYNGKEYKVLEK